MVLLKNIKTELSKIFTLKPKREEYWSEYLDDETKYINGKVYVHITDAPVYHKQYLKSIYFEVYDNNNVLFKIFVNGDNFIQEQLDNMQTLLDEEKITIPTTLINTETDYGIELRVPITTNGRLKLTLPPYNLLTDLYTGFMVKLLCKAQTLTVSNASKNNNQLTVTCNISNPSKNQSLKISTIYRNGKIHFTETKPLPNTNTQQTITVDYGDTDVKYKVELISYYNTQDKTYYLGKTITKNL